MRESGRAEAVAKEIYLELQWIAIAFVFGFLARRVGQPPLVGYLAAGIVLEAIGFKMVSHLEELSGIGIQLLLFSIGLKLDLRSVARREVWGVAVIHAVATTVGIGGVLFALGAAGVPFLSDLDLPLAALVGFALSFSSTIFVVKLLEERDDAVALYGRIAVGVLIVQDLLAVIFLTVSEGKVPSPFAFILLGLVFARPVVHRFLAFCGHGELLVLAGFALTLGGSSLFETLSMKGDLGALVFGVLAGAHIKSDELSKAIAPFKDIFLVGFFLTVGMTGLPDMTTIAIAAGLLVFVGFKSALFHILFLRFRLRARTSLFASLSLGNFSEFGLIVGALAVSKGWLGSEWVIVFAMTLAFSLVLSAPINAKGYRIYSRFRQWLYRFERQDRLPDERPLEVDDARVLVFGLGRIGIAAFDELRETWGDGVVGFDIDESRVAKHVAAGRRVFKASATDADAWTRLHVDEEAVELVVLAMSSYLDNYNAILLLKETNCHGLIAVTARFDDEEASYRKAGADIVMHVMTEAGQGLARDAMSQLQRARGKASGPQAAPPD